MPVCVFALLPWFSGKSTPSLCSSLTPNQQPFFFLFSTAWFIDRIHVTATYFLPRPLFWASHVTVRLIGLGLNMKQQYASLRDLLWSDLSGLRICFGSRCSWCALMDWNHMMGMRAREAALCLAASFHACQWTQGKNSLDCFKAQGLYIS